MKPSRFQPLLVSRGRLNSRHDLGRSSGLLKRRARSKTRDPRVSCLESRDAKDTRSFCIGRASSTCRWLAEKHVLNRKLHCIHECRHSVVKTHSRTEGEERKTHQCALGSTRFSLHAGDGTWLDWDLRPNFWHFVAAARTFSRIPIVRLTRHQDRVSGRRVAGR
jgi:hypothetical protein